MTAIFEKITILASVVLWGYSFSRIIDSYGVMQKKMFHFRQIIKDEMIPFDGVRRVNVFLIGALGIAYAVMLYFSGFAFWILVMVIGKFAVSAYLSDSFQNQVVQGKDFSKRLYVQMKIDAVFNALTGIFIVVLVFI